MTSPYVQQGGGEAADRGAKRRTSAPQGRKPRQKPTKGKARPHGEAGRGGCGAAPRRGASHAAAPAPRSGAQSTRPMGSTSQLKPEPKPHKRPKPIHQKKKKQ